MPRVLAVGHDGGRPEQRCHVDVMSAGVHDADFASGIVLGVDFAGVGQACLFFHRKPVEFGAQHDGWPGAVFQNGHDSRSAYVFRDRVAEIAQAARQLLRGLGFMRREFRILMEIKIESVGIGIDGLQPQRWARKSELRQERRAIQTAEHMPVSLWPHDIWSKDEAATDYVWADTLVRRI